MFITHGGIRSNTALSARRFRATPDTHRVGWLAAGRFAVGPELERTLEAAGTLAAALDTVDAVDMPPEVRSNGHQGSWEALCA